MKKKKFLVEKGSLFTLFDIFRPFSIFSTLFGHFDLIGSFSTISTLFDLFRSYSKFLAIIVGTNNGWQKSHNSDDDDQHHHHVAKTLPLHSISRRHRPMVLRAPTILVCKTTLTFYHIWRWFSLNHWLNLIKMWSRV